MNIEDLKIVMLSNANLYAQLNKENVNIIYDNLKDSFEILDILEYNFNIYEYNAELFSSFENSIIKQLIKTNVDSFMEIRQKDSSSELAIEYKEILKQFKDTSLTIETYILSKKDVRSYFNEINFGTDEFYKYIDDNKRINDVKTKLFVKENDNTINDLFISFNNSITIENKFDEIKCYLKAYYLYNNIGKKVKLDFDISEEIDLMSEDYLEYTGLNKKEKNKTYKKI